MDKKPLVIAQIMGKWVGGGVESVIMNYYINMNHDKIQFDFICDSDSTDIPYDEIKKYGGRVILCPPYQKIFEYEKFLVKLFKENKYKIVHSNINALSLFPLRAAKKAGVPIRIAHSHSTTNKKEWKKNLLKQVLRCFSKMYANKYFACSELAGRWLFGNKVFNEEKVKIINNAIDLNKYAFNENIRKEIRSKYSINDSTIVIGHIGRFVQQKNHDYLIDIFNEVHKLNSNTKLLLVGQGPLKDEIINKVSLYNLNDSVIFVGQVTNAFDYYNAMDLFILPSLYEGLGLVLVEAQANGLKCIASSEVPTLANVGGLVSYIDLNNKDEFINSIVNSKTNRTNVKEKIENNGYSIFKEVESLEKLYLEWGGIDVK